jgi:phosphate transport system substrate-binding protein
MQARRPGATVAPDAAVAALGRGPILLAVALLCAALHVAAASYEPQQPVSGDIRIWGSPEDGDLVKLWEDGFRKHQPQARVIAKLHGPESAMAGIYTGVAEIAFVGRELRLPTDNMAFQWVKLYRPTTVEIANAGFKAKRPAAGLAVFVHPDNPIAGLTVAQLDAIFGAEHKRGAANARTWGDVGLTGEWAARPIRVLAPPVTTIPALFFRKVVLDDSLKWNVDMKEVADDAKAVDAVASDPAAIAYAPMVAATGGVRALPLAKAGGAFVKPTGESAADRSYPLNRVVIVAVDKPIGKPLDPRVREFLRYVLSDEGQAAVAKDGAYLPLQPATVQKQLKLLD